MFTRDYWNNRVNKYGHTGHGEPFHYCFDQQARLFAIQTILNRPNTKKESALDFGCGSGDFVELLKHQFKFVHGFDISEKVIDLAKQRFNDSTVKLSTNIHDCITDTTYDLILTVTVLQTVSLEELRTLISLFHKILNSSGKLVCMEFFSTEEYNASSHENRVTTEEWVNLVQANNFSIHTVEGFYNPILFPTKSWQKFKGNIFLKFLKLFKQQVYVKKQLERIAKDLIYRKKDVFPYPTSSFKVYVLEKKKEI